MPVFVHGICDFAIGQKTFGHLSSYDSRSGIQPLLSQDSPLKAVKFFHSPGIQPSISGKILQEATRIDLAKDPLSGNEPSMSLFTYFALKPSHSRLSSFLITRWSGSAQENSALEPKPKSLSSARERPLVHCTSSLISAQEAARIKI